MRGLLATCLLIAVLSSVRAQDQERKLLDRLLKPDTSLQNSAQSKKFTADGASVDKRASVGTFYLQQKSKQRAFSNTHDFPARQFKSRSFNKGDDAKVKFSQSLANPPQNYPTSTARNLQPVHDATKKTEAGNFYGNRPFLGRGKSQKSLSKQNPPLTIEQVRELLNKNK